MYPYLSQIRAGTLAGGSRLPSIRQLAKSNGVSPSTVVTAFDRLVAQGLIEARPASGYFVAANTDIINALLKQKLTAVFTTSELDEYLVCTLLSDGGFHKHMSRLRSRLSHQRSQVVQGLQQAGLEPALAATGNLFVWAKLPPQVVLSELLENAYAAGFLLTPGNLLPLHLHQATAYRQ